MSDEGDLPGAEQGGGVARPAALRGTVIVLVLLGALAGVLLARTMQVPLYRCEGVIRVQVRLRDAEDPSGNQVLPLFDSFVAEQVRMLGANRVAEPALFESFVAGQIQLLQARRTTLLALETEAWKATGEPRDLAAAPRFEARREVLREGARPLVLLLVRFEDARPEVALAGVRALLEAYEMLAGEVNPTDENLRLARTQSSVLATRIQEITKRILELTQDYGGVEGLEVRHQAAVEQALECEEELQRLRAAIERGESIDGAHPEEMKKRAEELERRLKALREQVRELGQVRVEVERLQTAREEQSRELEQTKALGDQLASQLVGSGVVTIHDRGALPTEPHRRSPPWAPALGGVAGALLGLLLARWRVRRG